jgi:hypothetical protein
MTDGTPPPKESLRTGYEVRDADPLLVVVTGVLLHASGLVLLWFLWELSLALVPESRVPTASPPVLMPGEAPVDDRIRSVPQPRLDPLEPLEAEPASYRSSRPLPRSPSPTQHPEDLRPDRQPLLHEAGWVEKGKLARIPVGRAMDAVVEMEKGKAKKGGGK